LAFKAAAQKLATNELVRYPIRREIETEGLNLAVASRQRCKGTNHSGSHVQVSLYLATVSLYLAKSSKDILYTLSPPLGYIIVVHFQFSISLPNNYFILKL